MPDMSSYGPLSAICLHVTIRIARKDGSCWVDPVHPRLLGAHIIEFSTIPGQLSAVKGLNPHTQQHSQNLQSLWEENT